MYCIPVCSLVRSGAGNEEPQLSGMQYIKIPQLNTNNCYQTNFYLLKIIYGTMLHVEWRM